MPTRAQQAAPAGPWDPLSMPQQRGAANVGSRCPAGLFGPSRGCLGHERKSQNPQIATAPRCFALRSEHTYAWSFARRGDAESRKLSSWAHLRRSHESRDYAAGELTSSFFEIRRRHDEGVTTHMCCRNGAKNIGGRGRCMGTSFLVTFSKNPETENLRFS